MMFVYVMGRLEGPCKVGISRNPSARAIELQTGCPFRLEVLHQIKCYDLREAWKHEQIFHEVYSKRRLCGEWFDLDAKWAISGIVGVIETAAAFAERYR